MIEITIFRWANPILQALHSRKLDLRKPHLAHPPRRLFQVAVSGQKPIRRHELIVLEDGAASSHRRMLSIAFSGTPPSALPCSLSGMKAISSLVLAIPGFPVKGTGTGSWASWRPPSPPSPGPSSRRWTPRTPPSPATASYGSSWRASPSSWKGQGAEDGGLVQVRGRDGLGPGGETRPRLRLRSPPRCRAQEHCRAPKGSP